MIFASCDIIIVAQAEWLSGQRLEAERLRADAAADEASSVRRAKLRTIESRAAQIHEIDAQIELLLTLPACESDMTERLVSRLRTVRRQLADRKSDGL
jgi:hypothetical protein